MIYAVDYQVGFEANSSEEAKKLAEKWRDKRDKRIRIKSISPVYHNDLLFIKPVNSVAVSPDKEGR